MCLYILFVEYDLMSSLKNKLTSVTIDWIFSDWSKVNCCSRGTLSEWHDISFNPILLLCAIADSKLLGILCPSRLYRKHFLNASPSLKFNIRLNWLLHVGIFNLLLSLP